MTAPTCGRKLYDFADCHLIGTHHWRDTPIHKLRVLAARVARDNGVKVPTVKCGTASWQQGSVISLRRNHRNPVILLHEVSHLLQGDRGYPHGPAFVRRYFGLLTKYLGYDELHLLFGALFTGVKL